jgi:hypothetical protein
VKEYSANTSGLVPAIVMKERPLESTSLEREVAYAETGQAGVVEIAPA